jgi:hypothetical protein
LNTCQELSEKTLGSWVFLLLSQHIPCQGHGVGIKGTLMTHTGKRKINIKQNILSPDEIIPIFERN